MDVVAVPVGVDHPAHRFGGQTAERVDHLARCGRRGLGVDHQDPVVEHHDGGVALVEAQLGRLQRGVHAVAELLDCEAGRRRRRERSEQQEGGQDAGHGTLSFSKERRIWRWRAAGSPSSASCRRKLGSTSDGLHGAFRGNVGELRLVGVMADTPRRSLRPSAIVRLGGGVLKCR
ncbi:MAG TPA: hypothetical protein VGB99_08085 [Acidobacteriota bacterium]